MTGPDTAAVYRADFEVQVVAFVDEHRAMLLACLDDLTEEEARARLVPSKTTLLGLVKHAVFVERVWFGEVATGQTRTELGIAASPDESFDLAAEDTIESVRASYREAITLSRAASAGLSGDVIFPGNRRGRLTLRWILLHVLRELAQHCGHADVLREQLLARRER